MRSLTVTVCILFLASMGAPADADDDAERLIKRLAPTLEKIRKRHDVAKWRDLVNPECANPDLPDVMMYELCGAKPTETALKHLIIMRAKHEQDVNRRRGIKGGE